MLKTILPAIAAAGWRGILVTWHWKCPLQNMDSKLSSGRKRDLF
jgi:hypothetical protein